MLHEERYADAVRYYGEAVEEKTRSYEVGSEEYTGVYYSMSRMAKALARQGLWGIAEGLLKRCVGYEEEELAGVYAALGKHKQAEGVARRLLQAQERRYGVMGQ
jgi:tetratricopeptide (TPR) repeat protein